MYTTKSDLDHLLIQIKYVLLKMFVCISILYLYSCMYVYIYMYVFIDFDYNHTIWIKLRIHFRRQLNLMDTNTYKKNIFEIST